MPTLDHIRDIRLTLHFTRLSFHIVPAFVKKFIIQQFRLVVNLYKYVMDKRVNLITYKPGYGGHFIQFLLSLDKCTVPCIDKNTTFSQIDNSRKEHYSFKDLRKKHGHWLKHHKQYDGMNLDELVIRELVDNDQYHTANLQVHPYEFFHTGLMEYLQSTKEVSIKHLQISVSPKYEYVIDMFKICNSNFPKLRPFEEEMNEMITKNFNPYIINFDNFISGEEHFVDEYTKINNHLQLPLHLDDALELYRDWYVERRFIQYL